MARIFNSYGFSHNFLLAQEEKTLVATIYSLCGLLLEVEQLDSCGWRIKIVGTKRITKKFADLEKVQSFHNFYLITKVNPGGNRKLF